MANACNVARQFNRPAKYYRCLRDQLGALRNSSGEPDLSDLSPEQQEMIASACNVARQFNGPAKYYGCLRDQLGALRNSAERSEEHTSELQSRLHLVCRLLLEKKKINDSKLGLRSYIYSTDIQHGLTAHPPLR